MPADSGPPGRFRRAWLAFRHWRHTRPFLGGLLVTLGGAEILFSERAPLPLVIHIGLQGLAGYLVPIVIVLCGLLLLFNPVQRTFYALLAVLLSLASWITSNLGGFIIGLLLGVIGGALAFAWTQREQREQRARTPRPDKPRPVRTSGLALIRGEHRGDRQARQAEDPGDPADGGPGGDPSSFRTIRPTSLAPFALSALAVLAARGLVLVVTPTSASAASPAARPALPWLPSPSPSTDPAPSSPAPSPSQPTSPSPHPSGSPSASPSPSGPSAVPPRRLHAPALPAGKPGVAIAGDKASLSARFAVITGLSYDGIATVPTAMGKERMLKFSMDSLKLPGIALQVSDGGGSFLTTDSTLLLRGDVVLYTTLLSGVLHGVQVTFSPANPPSGLAKTITLTSVVAEQPFATADSVRAVDSTLNSR